MRADLHIHTTASDGRWTPTQVVAGCRSAGIGLFAVADHDAVANVLITEQLARLAGLGFIRAVEISTIENGLLLHILGYGIDPRDGELVALIDDNRARLEATDDEDIRRLIALGYPLDYDDYLAYDYDRTRGGFKSLNYLIDQGICSGPNDFFRDVRSRLNHPWPDFVSPQNAIDAIRAAGGVPVLAHPGASIAGDEGLREDVLSVLLGAGIGGLECYSQYHDVDTTTICVAWCEGHDLLITGGSDYHGGFVGRQLGIPEVDTSQLRLGSLWHLTGP
ncbi:MAG: PHP domain-containing protein [Anaerolineae bacterium]